MVAVSVMIGRASVTRDDAGAADGHVMTLRTTPTSDMPDEPVMPDDAAERRETPPVVVKDDAPAVIKDDAPTVIVKDNALGKSTASRVRRAPSPAVSTAGPALKFLVFAGWPHSGSPSARRGKR